MPGGVDVAKGVTIVFGTTSWTGQVTDISLEGQSVEEIEMTHHASAEPDLSADEYGGEEYLPGVIGPAGTIQLTVNGDPSNPPPLGQPPETITLTYRTKTGDSTAADIEGLGFVSSRSQALPVKGKVEWTLTIRKTGVWALTAAT